MDGSAFNHLGGAIEGFLNAVALLAITTAVLIIACIGMGIYIYVH